MMGKVGFGTLLARSLALACAEVPALRNVSIEADGPLRAAEPGTAAELADGGVLLVAHLLGLLGAFIGEDLTLRIVRGAWPTVPLPELEPQPNHNQ